jgi:hypothetical protein
MRTRKRIALSTFLVLALALSTVSALAADQVPGKVNVNTASEAELQSLPGVSKKQADKLIANRPYASVADLSKAGLSAKKIKKLAPLVTFGGAAAAASPAKTEKTAQPSSAGSASVSGASEHPTKPKAAAPPTGSEAAQTQTPPQPGMVWANSKTKIYHVEGDRYYGKTKNGQWMTESDALKAGYRKAKAN